MEEWRAIPGLEGYYEVSSLARVRSVPNFNRRNGTGKILKQRPTLGYQGFVYRKGKERNTHTMHVHRAMALAFIPNPEDLSDVNHKDSDKFNNNLDNLEWTTHLENVRHAQKNKLFCYGEDRKLAKLTNTKVREIRKKYVPHIYSTYKLAKEYGVSQMTIYHIVKNNIWKEVV